jgi:nicotinamide-nucleotide amidase
LPAVGQYPRSRIKAKFRYKNKKIRQNKEKAMQTDHASAQVPQQPIQASILSVGNEVLCGAVVNSNAAWIARQLSPQNIRVTEHRTILDDPAVIAQTLDALIQHAQLVVLTGGLGPTPDDMTIEGIAACFNVPLFHDAEQEEMIRACFKKHQRPMADINLKQALRPEGSHVIPNPLGTAPGMYWEVCPEPAKGQSPNQEQDKNNRPPVLVMAFPGVPQELYTMWDFALSVIKTYKTHYFADCLQTMTQNFFFSGIGESQMVSMIPQIFDQPGLQVGTYASSNRIIRLELSTQNKSITAGEAYLANYAQPVLETLNPYHLATGGNGLPEELIASLLIQKQWQLGVAESCTGGLISHCLTNVAGSSAYTRLNMVTYSNHKKTEFLGVLPETLAQHGAVSDPVAIEMARGMLTTGESDIALAITGIAGPGGGSAEKPVGLAYVAVACKAPVLQQGNAVQDNTMQNRLQANLIKDKPIQDNPLVCTRKITVYSGLSRMDIKQGFAQQALLFLLWCIKTDMQPV